MTQSEAILNYLKAGHTITSLEALNLFRCLRLASRVNDLRSIGFPIESKIVWSEDGKKHWAEYSFPQGQQKLL